MTVREGVVWAKAMVEMSVETEVMEGKEMEDAKEEGMVRGHVVREEEAVTVLEVVVWEVVEVLVRHLEVEATAA